MPGIIALDWIVDLAIIVMLLAGFRLFRSPEGARRGNLIAAAALAGAFLLVLLRHGLTDPLVVLLALLGGGLAGCGLALKVNMIQIPAMIAFQHGAGGVAAFMVSYVELTRQGLLLAPLNRVSGLLGLVIGAATFSGSMLASAKLANRMRQTPRALPGHNGLLAAGLAASVLVGLAAFRSPDPAICLVALIAIAVALGIVFAMRIGGADMPVLISFLNATAGLAAAFCGIVIENRLLVACGATVAASGSILTHVMCRAMNRNLGNIFLGVSGPVVAREAVVERDNNASDSRTPAERARAAFDEAATVVIVPGYGMALAGAQFLVARLAGRLEAMGKDVCFAIHPVAGRMPGHMNVVLAEADVDYDKLIEMDDINPRLAATDVVLVVGASDVVNPAAASLEGTPISGMPIIRAHEARRVVVCNLDDKPGYSGVENQLYASSATIMLLGDAQDSLQGILAGLEQT